MKVTIKLTKAQNLEFRPVFLLGNKPNRIRLISKFRNLEIHRMRFGLLPNKKYAIFRSKIASKRAMDV